MFGYPDGTLFLAFDILREKMNVSMEVFMAVLRPMGSLKASLHVRILLIIFALSSLDHSFLGGGWGTVDKALMTAGYLKRRFARYTFLFGNFVD